MNALSCWYRELVDASEEVSRIVPIHPDTYCKYEHPETVCNRLNLREHMLQRFIAMEREALYDTGRYGRRVTGACAKLYRNRDGQCGSNR